MLAVYVVVFFRVFIAPHDSTTDVSFMRGTSAGFRQHPPGRNTRRWNWDPCRGQRRAPYQSISPTSCAKASEARAVAPCVVRDRDVAEALRSCRSCLDKRGDDHCDAICPSFLALRPASARAREDVTKTPLAFAVVAHQSAFGLTKLMDMLWEPHYAFCVHVDAKSDDDFRTAASLMRREGNHIHVIDIDSGAVGVQYKTLSRLDADVLCMKDLLNGASSTNGMPPWTHVINVAGTELPLMSTARMESAVRRILGEDQSDIEIILNDRWFREISSKDGGDRFVGGGVVKGSGYGIFSRRFVRRMVAPSADEVDFFSLLKSLWQMGKGGAIFRDDPFERIYPTLAVNFATEDDADATGYERVPWKDIVGRNIVGMGTGLWTSPASPASAETYLLLAQRSCDARGPHCGGFVRCNGGLRDSRWRYYFKVDTHSPNAETRFDTTCELFRKNPHPTSLTPARSPALRNNAHAWWSKYVEWNDDGVHPRILTIRDLSKLTSDSCTQSGGGGNDHLRPVCAAYAPCEQV